LLDENEHPGGQLPKQIHKFFGSKRHMAGMRGYEIAGKLASKAFEAGVSFLPKSRVFNITNHSSYKEVAYICNNKVKVIRTKQLIIATGARENPLAVPGWTLPGVVTIGALQTMMNIHQVLPGNRFIIVGSGNAGLVVAHQILLAGGQIAAIVEAQNQPGGFAVHAAKITRLGTPVLTNHIVTSIKGSQKVQGVTIAHLNSQNNTFTMDADIVALAVGFHPAYELAQIAGVKSIFNNHFMPCHNKNMETSIEGIYCAGDSACVEEASIAMEEGRIAGAASAAKLGCLNKTEAHVKIAQAHQYLNKLRGYNKLNGAASSEQAAIESKTLTAAVAGSKALIRCSEKIPCNPCVSSCPAKAISMKPDITGLPQVDLAKCNGCKTCIAACPGQAIIAIDARDANLCKITIPYERYPTPKPGETWYGTDIHGNKICKVQILKTASRMSFDKTILVTFNTAREFALKIYDITT